MQAQPENYLDLNGGGFRYTFSTMRSAKFNPLEIPNYTVEEAARYLIVPVSTVRYWTIGEAGAAPLTTVYSRQPLLLSFKNLVELYVLESLQEFHDVGLPRITHDPSKNYGSKSLPNIPWLITNYDLGPQNLFGR